MFRFEHGNRKDLLIYIQVSLSALIINNRLYVENCIVFLSDGKPHTFINLGVSCLSDDTNDPPRLWFRLLDLAMYLSQQHSTASDLDAAVNDIPLSFRITKDLVSGQPVDHQYDIQYERYANYVSIL